MLSIHHHAWHYNDNVVVTVLMGNDDINLLIFKLVRHTRVVLIVLITTTYRVVLIVLITLLPTR